jgi:predicted Zn-dependent protease
MTVVANKPGSWPTPLEVAKLAVARAARLGADVEAYVQYGRTVSVKVFGRAVESVTVAEPRGIGLRAMRDGRTGYAFSTDVSEAGVARALEQVKTDLRRSAQCRFWEVPGPERAVAARRVCHDPGPEDRAGAQGRGRGA